MSVNTKEDKQIILTKNFFERDTVKVAKDLLGAVLVRKINGKAYKGIIVETEAYKQNDPACHAFKGRTKRAMTLFKEPGLSYVYMIYGMYYCLNIVTEPVDTAGAVLIRAIEPLCECLETNGPGKLCKALKVTKLDNEIDVCNFDSSICVFEGKKIPSSNIVKTSRIGIKQAANYPWRFYIKDNIFVSKK